MRWQPDLPASNRSFVVVEVKAASQSAAVRAANRFVSWVLYGKVSEGRVVVVTPAAPGHHELLSKMFGEES